VITVKASDVLVTCT